ncbi:MAG TPA: hypothetical protein PKA48_12405 [Candidatus Obscuribacter sp.]|nr:hypothetical protein [Candidatus Obscuribacter sp.]
MDRASTTHHGHKGEVGAAAQNHSLESQSLMYTGAPERFSFPPLKTTQPPIISNRQEANDRSQSGATATDRNQTGQVQTDQSRSQQTQPEKATNGQEPAAGSKPTYLSFATEDLYSSCHKPEASRAECYKYFLENYQKELAGYWSTVESQKKYGRPVLEFPPFYDGPAKPSGMEAVKPSSSAKLPSVDDMLMQSKALNRLVAADESQPDFTVKEITEEEFKRNYARETLRVGASLGLTRAETEKIVLNIYAFEGGGKATHDMLSGVPMELTKPEAEGHRELADKRRQMHPLSSAIGYNQIIMSTNLTFADGEGKVVADRLRELAKDSPRKEELEAKATLYENLQKTLHRELMEMVKAHPESKDKYLDKEGAPRYQLYVDFAKSTKPTGLGISGRQFSTALHALNLDGDIGPIVQSRQFAQVVGHTLKEETRFKLELKAQAINERADRFDFLPDKQKERAIEEVFARATRGQDKHDALKEKIKALPVGMSDALSKENLGEEDWRFLNTKILSQRRHGEKTPLSNASQNLVDKLQAVTYGRTRGNEYFGAAVELANLAGPRQADAMLEAKNAHLPTVNFFDRKGYEANPVVQRRTAEELLNAIYRIMHGPNASAELWGNAQFTRAFAQIN